MANHVANQQFMAHQQSMAHRQAPIQQFPHRQGHPQGHPGPLLLARAGGANQVQQVQWATQPHQVAGQGGLGQVQQGRPQNAQQQPKTQPATRTMTLNQPTIVKPPIITQHQDVNELRSPGRHNARIPLQPYLGGEASRQEQKLAQEAAKAQQPERINWEYNINSLLDYIKANCFPEPLIRFIPDGEKEKVRRCNYVRGWYDIAFSWQYKQQDITVIVGHVKKSVQAIKITKNLFNGRLPLADYNYYVFWHEERMQIGRKYYQSDGSKIVFNLDLNRYQYQGIYFQNIPLDKIPIVLSCGPENEFEYTEHCEDKMDEFQDLHKGIRNKGKIMRKPQVGQNLRRVPNIQENYADEGSSFLHRQ